MEFYTVFKKTGKVLFVTTGILLTFLLLFVFVLIPLLVKNQRIIGFLPSVHIENIHWNPFSSIEFKNVKLSSSDLKLLSEIDSLQFKYGNPWNLIRLNFESLNLKIKTFTVDLTDKKEETKLTTDIEKLNLYTKMIPHIKKINIEVENFSVKASQGSLAGSISIAAGLSKQSNQIHLKLNTTKSQTTFESADGKIFVDKFKVEPQGTLVFDFKNENPLQGELNIGFGGGEIVYHSFYANLKNTYFFSKIQLQLLSGHPTFKIGFPNIELMFEEKLLLQAYGDITPQNKTLQLHLSSKLHNLSGIQKIVQSTLSETYALLKELETQGSINLSLDISGIWDALSFTGELGMKQFSLNIPSKKVSLKNAELMLPFSFSQTTARELASIEKIGKISFESLAKDKLSINKISCGLNNMNNAISIKSPVTIKMFGGVVQLKKTLLQVFPSEERHVEMSLSADNLSMKSIFDFLGLPRMNGTIHSKINLLKLDSENLEIKGTTQVHAWEGSVVVKNVNIAEPFGLVPTIKVDAISINRVRLLPITEDLGFGIIDGTINGYVNNLTVIEKKPVSFAMEIKSARGASQVISVQAIKNITQLSGDSSAFSNSFMFSLINNFKYSHLGFRAKLDGDLLQLEPNHSSGTTAYLIKGSFFPPSVDILYRNEVHKKIPLPELMERLKNIDWHKTYVK